MQKRRHLFLILIGVGVLVGVLAVVFRPAPEPEYHGKRLSEWVECRGKFLSPQIRGSASELLQMLLMRDEAEDAMLQAGTNAIPFLLAWIRYEPADWKRKAFTQINSRFHLRLIDHNAPRADGTVWAFSVLGRKAESAVPSLALVMKDVRAPQSADRATMVLFDLASKLPTADLALMTNNSASVRLQRVWKRGGRPLPKSALMALAGITVLENDTEIANAAARIAPFQLALMTNNSASIRLISIEKLSQAPLESLHSALPGLIHSLHDKDADVAEAAAKVLGRAELDAGLVVPALAASLERRVVRRSAIDALGALGVKARPAVPALVILLNDPVPLIRKLATNALLRIDSDVLVKATAADK